MTKSKTAKKSVFAASIVLLGLMLPAGAQDNPLLWRGRLETDHRILLRHEREWAWNENRLELQLEKRANPLRVVSNVWIRHLGPATAERSTELQDKNRIHPLRPELREAYAGVYGFISDRLDMTIGRQHIAWGTADRFNPTNNLNPPDLEDILDFGRSKGSDALNLQWHFDHHSSLQLVFIPLFRPANLPAGIFSGLFDLPIEPPAGLRIGTYTDTLEMPHNNLRKAGSLGGRFRALAGNTDVSVSYVWGPDPLPLPREAWVQASGSSHALDVEAVLFYPYRHIIGADMAGSIGRTGIWAEAALFIPTREVVLTTHISPPAALPMPLPPQTQETILEKEPYLRIVAGADYTLSGGTYLNIQYIRGFLHERGRDALNDYLVVQTSRHLRQNTLRVEPVTGGFTVADRGDPAGNYGFFYAPSIAYLGVDNLEFSLGAFLFGGKGNNLFAGLLELHMIRLHARASF